MHHILLGIVDGWRQRKTLRSLLKATSAGQTVLDLEPEGLASSGIAVLALDFDGVLASHGSDCPLPEVERWLQQVVELLGAEKVLILSNRPEGPRVDWFKEHFPGVRFVAGVRKKPYPDGLQKTGELASAPLSSIMMVDDRLLTGCLAAINAGSIPCYIRAPFVNLRANFRKELFFMFLRWAERQFVQLFP